MKKVDFLATIVCCTLGASFLMYDVVGSTAEAKSSDIQKNVIVSNKPINPQNSNAPQFSESKRPIKEADNKKVQLKTKAKLEQEKNKKALPAEYKNILIAGKTELSPEQAVAHIKSVNPNPKLSCSIEEIVDIYFKEAAAEGIRGDVALCQALVETGYFSFSGTVKPNQNNFCGLGTTGGGVKGAFFKTPELGARAHIQHLMAYAVKDKPKAKIVDPRYDLVHNMRKADKFFLKWSDLDGRWATSSGYSAKIFTLYYRMADTKAVEIKNNKNKVENNMQQQESFKDRIAKILDEIKKQKK